jgi:hypothetical protein
MWVQTSSGKAVSLLAPQPESICLEDIAFGLARIPRFNGQTPPGREWSVSQHSLLVLALAGVDATTELKLALLFHDAPEAYMGDLTSPFKRTVHKMLLPYTSVDPIELIFYRLMITINRHFNMAQSLSPFDYEKRKELDLLALKIEKAALLGPEPLPWSIDMSLPPDYDSVVERVQAQAYHALSPQDKANAFCRKARILLP